MSDNIADNNYHFTTADSIPGQHTQLDFINHTWNALRNSRVNITVNAEGTELSFEAFSSLRSDLWDDEQINLLCRADDADQDKFGLADKAVEMAKLFRVNERAFDPAHDREQEILNGMVQRIHTFGLSKKVRGKVKTSGDQSGGVTYPNLGE